MHGVFRGERHVSPFDPRVPRGMEMLFGLDDIIMGCRGAGTRPDWWRCGQTHLSACHGSTPWMANLQLCQPEFPQGKTGGLEHPLRIERTGERPSQDRRACKIGALSNFVLHARTSCGHRNALPITELLCCAVFWHRKYPCPIHAMTGTPNPPPTPCPTDKTV